MRLSTRVLVTGAAATLAGLGGLVAGPAGASYSNDCQSASMQAGGYMSDPTGLGVINVPGVYFDVDRNGRTNNVQVTSVGVCTQDSAHGGLAPIGGDLEAGVNPNGNAHAGTGPVGFYGILDGSDSNTVPGTTGYAGVSNFETASSNSHVGSGDTTCPDNTNQQGAGCTSPNPTPVSGECSESDADHTGTGGGTPGSGSGTNSGGGLFLKPLCNDQLAPVVGDSNATLIANTMYAAESTVPLPIACGFTTGPSWDNTKRDGCWVP